MKCGNCGEEYGGGFFSKNPHAVTEPDWHGPMTTYSTRFTCNPTGEPFAYHVRFDEKTPLSHQFYECLQCNRRAPDVTRCAKCNDWYCSLCAMFPGDTYRHKECGKSTGCKRCDRGDTRFEVGGMYPIKHHGGWPEIECTAHEYIEWKSAHDPELAKVYSVSDMD